MVDNFEIYSVKIMSEKPWISVCELSDLLPDTGVCALVNKQQVAIFRSRRLNEVFAVSNYDPIGEANVLSRGIIGSIGDEVVGLMGSLWVALFFCFTQIILAADK